MNMSRNENAKAAGPEKSDFTRRCSLLSRYLKEKGSFGNIDLGLFRKPNSDLGISDLPGNQNALQKTEHPKGEPCTSSGGKVKDADLRESEPPSSQLTIFFGGKIIVYNEFPADKAKEIMEVAKQAKPVTEKFPANKAIEIMEVAKQAKPVTEKFPAYKAKEIMEVAKQAKPVTEKFPAYKAIEIMEVAKQAKPVTEINIHETQTNVDNNDSNMVLPDLNEPTDSADTDHNHPTKEQQQQQQQSQIVERIARRASLHRFFAKRKDRAVARAPYQVNQNAGNHRYPPKPEIVAGQPLEPGQSSQRPDNAIAQTVAHPKSDVTMEIEEGQSSKDLDLRL